MNGLSDPAGTPMPCSVLSQRVRTGCGVAVIAGVAAALVAFASDGPATRGLREASVYVAALLIWGAVAGDEVAALLGLRGKALDGALSGSVQVFGCFAFMVVGLLNHFTGTWAAAVPAVCLFLLAWALAALAHSQACCNERIENGPTSSISKGAQTHE